MKVLFIDFALDKLGGVERVICTLANGLCDKNNVEACSVYKNSKNPFYKYKEEIRINYLIDNSSKPSTKSKTKLGFYFYRTFEKVCEMFYINKRIKTFCTQKIPEFDVIIFGRTEVAIKFLPFMKKYNGKIIVRDANHLYSVNIWCKKCIKKYFPNMVSTFIVSSEESLKLYNNFFSDSHITIKKLYNPLGISPRMCNCLENKRILGVGRYCYEKGFENLIFAFAQIHQKFPEWKLALVGGGQDEARYIRICKKLGVFEKVELYKSADIVEDYCKAGIFVMSSRGEGYANALVEALSCGVPSITYDWYVGANDIVEDGENGLIVHLKDRDKYFRTKEIDMEDVINLADAISRLIQNDDLRMKLSQNAIKINESRQCTSIINEWEKIIEGIY